MTRQKGGCWPTEQQRLLLRAALLKNEDALRAWRDWKSSADWDRLDVGSYRLLPQLYRNLRTLGFEDSRMKMLKGIYLHTWAKNQILLRTMTPLLRSFHDAGISTLLLKGAALILRYYKEYGLRPMSDFDVLVPTDQASAAMDLVRSLGWKPMWPKVQSLRDAYISVSHSHGFKDVDGLEMDLHWHVMQECSGRHADDDFWGDAVLTTIHDVQTYTLNSTDHLLHICAHGAMWNPLPPFRWAADAITILDAAETDIDWSRLVLQAQRLRLTYMMCDTLNFLRDVLEANIPSRVFRDLESSPKTDRERNEYRAKTRQMEFLGALPELWHRYLSLLDDGGLVLRLTGFPKYLRLIWHVDHLWQLPLHALHKVGTRSGIIAFRLAKPFSTKLAQWGRKKMHPTN